jgi:glycolate oxidase iron-sulfur subunit
MLHRVPVETLGPRGEAMAQAITSCVHCGFCLPTCPTYEVLGDESDSPRGRIFLMKEVLEGNLAADQAAPHIDRCLGCVACQTACPSGVQYGELISSYRALHPVPQARSRWARLRRRIASLTVPYPKRFALAMRMGRLSRSLAKFAPRGMRPLVDLIPENLPAAEVPPELSPAVGTQRASVNLHIGCAAQVLNPDITSSAIRVLTRAGVAVRVPRAQACCGALHWHVGDAQHAAKLAKHNLDAFGSLPDAILTTAAGCGSGMHEYPLMLAGDARQDDAEQFAQRVMDVSVFLNRLELEEMAVERPLRIAYHDACHLAHAQRVRQPPRELLRRIKGVTLVELTDAEFCCGSAGTYNIDQPEIAAELGARKAQAVIAADCDLVALGNIGCQVQIEQHLRKAGSAIPVLHVVQILDRVQRGALGGLSRQRSASL